MIFVGYLEARKREITIDEEKRIITRGIVDTSFAMMKEIMNNLTPNNRARKWLGKHSQSKTNVARDTTLFNVLIGKQKPPALPRHFRNNLADKEKNIGRWDLRKDILEPLVNNHILANRIGVFEQRKTKGRRPLKSSEIETRGRKD